MLPTVNIIPEYDISIEKLKFSHYENTDFSINKHFIVIPKTQRDIFNYQLQLGYLDAITNIKLKTTKDAQVVFTQQHVIITSLIQVGAVQLTDIQDFWDFNEEKRSLPAGELLAMLLRYGVFCYQLFKDYAP